MDVITLTSSGESDQEKSNYVEDDVEVIEPIEVIPLDGIEEEETPSFSSKTLDLEVEQFADKQIHTEDDVSLLDIPSVIPRKNPEVAYVVYGQVKSALYTWNRGVVNAVTENFVFKMVEYDVKFEVKKFKYVNGERKNEYRTVFRSLPANLLAYPISTPFKLPVGSRVIALLRNPLETEEQNQDNFYVGIIAEPLKPKNNRYLIFFDDGSAQYTKHVDVRLVYASSTKVWNDVYPDTRKFIEEYLKKYPEVPLMAVTKNSRITVEWNGKPWIAKVVEIDHSLVKLQFECRGHSEWIFRGSQRLLRYQSKRLNIQNCEAIQQEAQGQNLPYTIELDSIFGEVEKYIPLVCPVESCIEHEGKMEKLDISSPKSVEGADPFMVAHQCARRCLPRYNVQDYLGVPPLAVPFHLGFTRVINDRSVYYKGPCGKVFPNYDAVYRFLVQTKSELGIDHFTFEKSVRCITKFVPKTIHFKIKDISYGVNGMPVECVNSLGMDKPGYFAYTNDMLPSDDLKINQDNDFLTCCDCVDDCQDQKRCSCWQLTLSGIAFNNHNPRLIPPKGYEYRRLYDFVVSGIYECNKGCKCRKTCLNRVIQNSNSRYPLQVFKTNKKGWAIRPLCDIPVGSFICTYGGQILSESKANEDGKKFGDEYLAAMDYIEVVERNKFGYESSPDVTDSDHDADDNADLNTSVNSEVTPMQVCMRKTISVASPNQSNDDTSRKRKKPKSPKQKSTRQCFGKDEEMFVMDAKTTGNIGRYLNHSCDPNVFVQNTFVDSHDIRFPWVSFFASQTIKAGTELTWNYSYEIGCIPGKVLYCYCATPRCKLRLL